MPYGEAKKKKKKKGLLLLFCSVAKLCPALNNNSNRRVCAKPSDPALCLPSLSPSRGLHCFLPDVPGEGSCPFYRTLAVLLGRVSVYPPAMHMGCSRLLSASPSQLVQAIVVSFPHQPIFYVSPVLFASWDTMICNLNTNMLLISLFSVLTSGIQSQCLCLVGISST